jgi:hypothetical protein
MEQAEPVPDWPDRGNPGHDRRPGAARDRHRSLGDERRARGDVNGRQIDYEYALDDGGYLPVPAGTPSPH